jgi:hypothetical protein
MGELHGAIPSLMLEIATFFVDDPSSLSLYVHEGSETTELILFGVSPTILSPGEMYGPSPDCKQIFDGEAVCANVCGFVLKRSICFEP